ncbi:dnaJ homolog subfamily C member 10-like [Onthophagus taurus]|uniref:dnaJ homolog subfamily C member 10-like n=1 Tax=Onthophagus taurus TaxID=166361 RepID=UPI0039BDE52A
MRFIKRNLITIVLVLSFLITLSLGAEDYYKLLGVSRDASDKDIRKAFKSLALKLHPDKNQDDPEADNKFSKIARAYEVLKNPEDRKHYDLYGDDEHNFKRPTYHSYSYYRDDFGLYDEDPLIITLTKADYDFNVHGDNKPWFINFYSPQCHHCHDLAPTWRKLSQEMEGIVQLAAVNCAEDWSLCNKMGIMAYPTLIFYEKEAHVDDGEHYQLDRTLDVMQEYIISKLNVEIEDIMGDDWKEEKRFNDGVLLFLCSCNDICHEDILKIKVSAAMEGIMPVGDLKNSNLCESHKSSSILFYENGQAHPIDGSDTKEIISNILEYLPNPTQITTEKFKTIREKLRNGDENPWLICFYVGSAVDLNLQIKRLSISIPNINVGMVHCGQFSSLCHSLHVSKYPTWGILKNGGAFEIHHGRDVLHEVRSFAKDGVKSTNFNALSPADFQNIIKSGDPWFIDFFAPWCPPCRSLMPELRRASLHFQPAQIQFGTIDCTMYSDLCAKEGIRSYPTTMIYNNSKTLHYHGSPSEHGIVEFIESVIDDGVIHLDGDTFLKVLRKVPTELWIVDFVAPWCGPCQKLTNEWRKLAKELSAFSEIKVGSVDCVAHNDLCSAQQIRSYPSIRLYPFGSKGLETVAMYNGHRDVMSMKRWVISFMPSLVESFTSEEFQQQVLTKKYVLPWLIDFYASWCSHCINFEPNFNIVARKLQGKVRCGKIDCDPENHFCRKQKISSYPTIMLYLSPNQRFEIDSQVPKEIISEVFKIMDQQGFKMRDEL